MRCLFLEPGAQFSGLLVLWVEKKEDPSFLRFKVGVFPSHIVSDKLADSVLRSQVTPRFRSLRQSHTMETRDTRGESRAPGSNSVLTGVRPCYPAGRGPDGPNPCQGRARTDPLPGEESSVLVS